MRTQIEIDVAGRNLTIETGHVARQADGACMVRYGGTVVLATVVSSRRPDPTRDFFPLTVDYREKAYAGGKIPGGFFKREGRPGERETLICRLIDRPIRPLFPEGYRNNTHVVAFALSTDKENDPDILALIGASTALTISDIPFQGPVGAARVGRIDGQFVLNPTASQLENSDLNLVVAGTLDAVVMVEGGAQEIDDLVLCDAIGFAHETIKGICEAQLRLREQVGKEKRAVPVEEGEIVLSPEEKEFSDPEAMIASYQGKLLEALQLPDKIESRDRQQEIIDEILSRCDLEVEGCAKRVTARVQEMIKSMARRMILEEHRRVDGRALDEIRPITCEVGVLPETHGSALFTRGQTQALVVNTLGTSSDEQKIETIQEESWKAFLLHYNFPPFCVGEAGFLRGPGRREIGHGALAERALLPLIPPAEEFPYTIRLVSDILESNGSSSMATVCGSSLALMDGGVPIKAPVAGIAMGLVVDGERVAILSDISGMEDHLGDMDFKVAGTAQGVTAVQMDIKIKGLSLDLLRRAMEQARRGRLFILERMNEVISEPRPDLPPNAPRILSLQINPDKIKDVIGPGGKVIRGIIAETGVKIDVDDSGVILIASPDLEAAARAKQIIEELTEDVEIGKEYTGKVTRLESYGAFIEILPGTDGLLHISQVADYRVRDIHDELKLGDKIAVKVISIDPQGKVRLGRPEVLAAGDTHGGGHHRGGHDGRRNDRREHHGSRRDRDDRRGGRSHDDRGRRHARNDQGGRGDRDRRRGEGNSRNRNSEGNRDRGRSGRSSNRRRPRGERSPASAGGSSRGRGDADDA
jgi:polyribonucleotide nucleotidyltransferase